MATDERDELPVNVLIDVELHGTAGRAEQNDLAFPGDPLEGLSHDRRELWLFTGTSEREGIPRALPPGAASGIAGGGAFGYGHPARVLRLRSE